MKVFFLKEVNNFQPENEGNEWIETNDKEGSDITD